MKYFVILLVCLPILAQNLDQAIIAPTNNDQESIKFFELFTPFKVTHLNLKNTCKPEDSEMPRSFKLMLEASMNFYLKENLRNEIYQREIEKIKAKIESLNQNRYSSGSQTETLLLQLEAYELSILFLNGNGGRIDSLESEHHNIQMIKENSRIENEKWKNSYSSYETTINSTIKEAQKYCLENPKLENCEKGIDILKEILNSVYIKYKKAYEKIDLSSIKDIEEISKIETDLKSKISSIDDSLKWKSKILNGLNELIKTRKVTGLSCNIKNAKELLTKEEDEILNAFDKSLAVGADRERYFLNFANIYDKFFLLEKEKALELMNQKTLLTKLLINVVDLNSYKSDINAECGGDPRGQSIVICPDPKNPLCNPYSEESKTNAAFKSCRDRKSLINNQIEALSRLPDKFKNDPNFLGVEGRTYGPAGIIFEAKFKNPDGSFRYEIIPNQSQSNVNFSPFVSGPTPSPKNNLPSSTNSSTTKDPNKKNQLVDLKYDYDKKFEKFDPKDRIDSKLACNTKPINKFIYASCPSKTYNPWCDPDSKERKELDRYNACIKSLNEHNEIADAYLNLSPDLLKHKEFDRIIRSKETGELMARLKKEKGEFYFLPLDFKNP